MIENRGVLASRSATLQNQSLQLSETGSSVIFAICVLQPTAGLKVNSSITISGVGFNEYFLRWSMELEPCLSATSGGPPM